MKRVFLLMVVSAVLVTLGWAQTPDAGSNTDLANVKGCLGGSDGNYTITEDGSHQIFKITTSSVDLKPHVGHDVKLIGQRTIGAVSSGTNNSSLAVTEVSMISEHCAAAAAAAAVAPYSQTAIEPTPPAAAPAVEAAAPAATVTPSSATASAPVEAATPATAANPPAATVSTPAVEAPPPVAAVDPSSTTVSASATTPPVEAAAPAAAASPSSTTVSSPVAEAARPARPSAHARKLAAAQEAAAKEAADAAPVSPSPDTVNPPAPEVTTPAAAATPSPETSNSPDVTATAPTVTHRPGSLILLISFVVLVIVLGTMAPLIGRWRKRKLLERNGAENLSFTNEESAGDVIANQASSGRDKPGPRKVA